MKLLNSAKKINTQLGKLMDYKEYYWAVAWATPNKLLTTLVRRKKRIRKLVIGTHFYQTDPEVLETFVGSDQVHFNFDTSSVFHPKLYLFYNSDTKWACILGSPNFTHSALNKNDEVAVLFTNEDDPNGSMFKDLMKTIDQYWEKADEVDEDKARAYRKLHQLNRKKLKALADTDTDSGAKPSVPAINCEIRTSDWRDYYEQLQQDKYHAFDERLNLLDAAQTCFANHRHFRDLPKDMRRCLAGLQPGSEDYDWRWFGSMQGAGKFQNRINANDFFISEALDAIPQTGMVSRSHFMNAVSKFKRAFPNGRDGIGILSRLLTMKRPDSFFCIDTPNRKSICKKMGVKLIQSSHYERYWDELIERLIETPWYQSPQPAEGDELRAWRGRMAILDAIIYAPE